MLVNSEQPEIGQGPILPPGELTMCNPRSTTLPAIIVTSSSASRLLSGLRESGMDEALRVMARRILVAPLQRLWWNGGPRRG